MSTSTGDSHVAANTATVRQMLQRLSVGDPDYQEQLEWLAGDALLGGRIVAETWTSWDNLAALTQLGHFLSAQSR